MAAVSVGQISEFQSELESIRHGVFGKTFAVFHC